MDTIHITPEMVGKFIVMRQEYDNEYPHLKVISLEDMDTQTKFDCGVLTQEEYDALILQERIESLRQSIEYYLYNLEMSKQMLKDLL